MQPPRGSPRHLPVALALGLLVVGLLVPAEAQSATGDATMQVILADPALGGAAQNNARLDVEITAALRVEEDDVGRHVRMVMPQAHDPAASLSPMDLHFFAPAGHTTNGKWQLETTNGSQTYAVFRWRENAPEPGTTVPDVTLEVARNVRLNDMVTIIWASHTFDNLSLRVDLPRTHEVLSPGATPQSHNVAANRNVWNATVTDPSISAIIRPTAAIPDPAFGTYRPSAVTAWLIVAVLAVLSGGAWVLGKRLERNPAEEPGLAGPKDEKDAPRDGGGT